MGKTSGSSKMPGCIAENGADMAELPPAPMGVRQTADYLGVGENVVRSLCRTGRLNAFKPKGQWRILPSDLSDYIMKQLQKK